jgi:hypothetical protein
MVLMFSAGQGSWWSLTQSLPALFSMFAIMFLRYGHPKHWWSPFFGHNMYASLTKLSHREAAGEDAETIRQEIADWVSQCTKGSHIKLNPYACRFLNKSDAMMFKLAWG